MRKLMIIGCVAALAALAMGCSNKKLLNQKDQEIASLQGDVTQLRADLEAERRRTAELNQQLDAALAEMREKEQVWMEEKNGLTHITLDGSVTFSSGSTRITSSGQEILQQIWDVLVQYPEREVLIEGHTDNVPIAPEFQNRFRSNWELSSARAHSVLHFVRKRYDIDPQRIGAVGYGEFRPIADNSTPEGRSKNRRVVITVGSRAEMEAQRMQP